MARTERTPAAWLGTAGGVGLAWILSQGSSGDPWTAPSGGRSFDWMPDPLLQDNGSEGRSGVTPDQIRDELRRSGTGIASQGSGAPGPEGPEEPEGSWDPESRDVGMSTRDLQHNFRRARAFGVSSNWSRAGEAEFRQALNAHLRNENTMIIRGELRREQAVHFYNPQTNLNVTTRPNGTLWSSGRLSADQIRHLLATGRLGGN